MIQESAANFPPIWMLLSAAFGFLVGDAFGDSNRHRKCLQQINDDLRDRLDEVTAGGEPIQRQLTQQRGILNDIHKQLRTVTKGLEKPPS